jgi:hypothetical protein
MLALIPLPREKKINPLKSVFTVRDINCSITEINTWYFYRPNIPKSIFMFSNDKCIWPRDRGKNEACIFKDHTSSCQLLV